MDQHSIISRPLIAVTMGDPAGVGPELCVRLLAEPSVLEDSLPIIWGDAEVLEAAAASTGQKLASAVISLSDFTRGMSVNGPTVIDCGAIELSQFKPGTVNAATGDASFQFIQRAIDAALAGRVAAITTAPISKEALHLAGHQFPGHTEIFASRTQSNRWCMMQYSEEVVCTFATVHCGYAEVPQLLTTQRILDVIELTHEALVKIRDRIPRILVCGLNPHAGEHGLFGRREEERIIAPAVELARKKGFWVEGPLPPDTAFVPARRRTSDAVVCMYHDQGHIPVKALAFDSAVNTTLGLPIVRTSVDHGTALDIAWKGLANPGSLYSAIRLATKLATKSLKT